MVDPVTVTTRLSSITGLGAMIKSWQEARKASLEYAKVKEEVGKKVLAAKTEGEKSITTKDQQVIEGLTISPAILKAMIDEMKRAEDRFAAVFGDVTYTPAQIDQEEQIARATICRHLERIKSYNRQELPEGELQRLWISYQCGK